MKTILITFFLSLTLLFAGSGDDNLKIKILQKIVTGIENSENMKIWSDNIQIKEAFHAAGRHEVTSECQNADILILQSKENLPSECKKHHVFVLSYKLLNDIPESFGAFFWKKGRPNIVFIEPRVKKNSLELSVEMEPYIETKVW